MTKLDALRERFRKVPLPPPASPEADVAVEVAHMTPDAQLAAIDADATLQGWPEESKVHFRDGHFCIDHGGKTHRLPFRADPDHELGPAEPLVPVYTLAVKDGMKHISGGAKAKKRKKAKKPVRLIEDGGKDAGLVSHSAGGLWRSVEEIADRITELAGEELGWPEGSTVEVDRDIMKGETLITLTDGERSALVVIKDDQLDTEFEFTVPGYKLCPHRFTMSPGTMPMAIRMETGKRLGRAGWPIGAKVRVDSIHDGVVSMSVVYEKKSPIVPSHIRYKREADCKLVSTGPEIAIAIPSYESTADVAY